MTINSLKTAPLGGFFMPKKGNNSPDPISSNSFIFAATGLGHESFLVNFYHLPRRFTL